MFGDSPWDYMSDEERKAKQRQWDEHDKLVKARAKKHKLLALREYSTSELVSELHRRNKLNNNGTRLHTRA